MSVCVCVCVCVCVQALNAVKDNQHIQTLQGTASKLAADARCVPCACSGVGAEGGGGGMSECGQGEKRGWRIDGQGGLAGKRTGGSGGSAPECLCS